VCIFTKNNDSNERAYLFSELFAPIAVIAMRDIFESGETKKQSKSVVIKLMGKIYNFS